MISEHVAVAEPITSEYADSTSFGGAGRRAVFLDRDGVINVNHGYVHTPEATDWVPGIFDFSRAARHAGYLLIVVTNQAGIARGFYSREQFVAYTQWQHARFESEAAPLLATYYCPHHPVFGLGEYHVECECRKPKPGMLLAAAERYGIDLGRSIMLGDKVSDMEAARAAGIGVSRVIEDVVPPFFLLMGSLG